MTADGDDSRPKPNHATGPADASVGAGAPAATQGDETTAEQHPTFVERLRTEMGRLWPRIKRQFKHEGSLDYGLERLQASLGLEPSREARIRVPNMPIMVKPSESYGRAITYAPDMDGQADAGEVVWIHVPSRRTHVLLVEKPALVVARNAHSVLALLISTDDRFSDHPQWMAIGTGGWDRTGKSAWVRVDRTMEVPDNLLRRQGTVLPFRRFNRVAHRLQEDYEWR